MGLMIVCVTALVALGWAVCVMPRRTHVYASAGAYRYVAFGHVPDWIVERNSQMRGGGGHGRVIRHRRRIGIAEPARSTVAVGRASSGSSHGSTQEGSTMMKHVMGACATALILVVALSHPDVAVAHGATSGEDDPCLRQVGEKVVHFSAYQPQYQLKDQYCTDIPKEGDTFLVVDLVDPTLRNELVGMRVTKGNGSKEADDQIVADIRPSIHPDGVLRGEVRLDEGLYTVTIAAEKQNLMKRPQYLLRVRMTDYQQLVRTLAVPLLAALLTAWLGYKLLRSTWLRKWWAVLCS